MVPLGNAHARGCLESVHLPSSLECRFEFSTHWAPQQGSHQHVCSRHEIQWGCASEEHGNCLHVKAFSAVSESADEEASL